ncbi:MAG: TIGR03088 family PEP-CTERM/XrtA system glycosyltransferase [Deltaproteobacteria bacterium]|nr:MAG: TIGR03088 family PEP-CTERM/XrtA system glycosyltransferase [Deltaproteobacteria bacterium]
MTSKIPPAERSQPPLVAHVIQRLAVGGLENGLVNLINHMAHDRYRHVIICLTESTDYSRRLQRDDVPIVELHQQTGQSVSVHKRFFEVLRRFEPDIVHTRNLPAMEFQVVAALMGVRGRIHGEHGRDMYDLDGTNFKYNSLRKVVRLFIHRYTAVSRNLADWLVNTVKVRRERVTQIYNGVESEKFRPRKGPREAVGPTGFCSSESFVVGTVGRMEPVKDQLTFVRAFIHLLREDADLRPRMRLILVGDGSLREQALDLLRQAQAERLAWLPGERRDIPEIMRAMDLFVLPSIREGISNTILEAMASGLPVIATDVGGNPELLAPGKTGMFVPPSDPISMARAIRSYFEDAEKRSEHGAAGRIRIENQFSMEAMVDGYLKIYDVVMREQSLKMITPTSTSVVSRRT